MPRLRGTGEGSMVDGESGSLKEGEEGEGGKSMSNLSDG